MSDKEIITYIKSEANSELLYLVAVTCIERLVHLRKAGAVKAIIDSATTSLLKMIHK